MESEVWGGTGFWGLFSSRKGLLKLTNDTLAYTGKEQSFTVPVSAVYVSLHLLILEIYVDGKKYEFSFHHPLLLYLFGFWTNLLSSKALAIRWFHTLKEAGANQHDQVLERPTHRWAWVLGPIALIAIPLLLYLLTSRIFELNALPDWSVVPILLPVAIGIIGLPVGIVYALFGKKVKQK